MDQAIEQLRAQDEIHDVDTSWDPGFVEIHSLYGADYGVRWVTLTDGIEDRVREAVDAAVGIDFDLDYTVVTLDLQDLKAAGRRVRAAVPETADLSSNLDLATGTIVFYALTPPGPALVQAVEAAAAPAHARWEEGTSVAY